MDGISQRLMLALQGMTPMFVGKDFHSQSKSLAKDLTTMMIQMARTEFPASSGAQTQAPPTQAETEVIDEVVHILPFYSDYYDYDDLGLKTGMSDSVSIVHDMIKTARRLEGLEDIDAKYRGEESLYTYQSDESVPAWEMYLPFVYKDLPTRRTVEIETSVTGEKTVEKRPEQDQLEEKLKRHREQVESACKLACMIYYGGSAETTPQAAYETKFDDMTRISSYGMWGKWYDLTNGWHRGIDMCLGPGRNIYAICDGYPIQKKSYYFNVFIPEFNITVTYMHLAVSSTIGNLIDEVNQKIASNSSSKQEPPVKTLLDNYEAICEGIEQGSIPTGAEAKFQELQDERMEALREQMRQGIPKTPSQLEKILRDLETIQMQTKRLEQIKARIQEMQSSGRILPGSQEELKNLSAEQASLYGEQMAASMVYLGVPKLQKGQLVGTESDIGADGVMHTHVEINKGFFTTDILRPWASFAGYGAGVGQLSTIQSPKISDIIEANPELEGFSMNPYPYIDAWFEAYREERA